MNKNIACLREEHLRTQEEPRKLPLIWVRDKQSGIMHLYGTNSHDSLHIGADGQLHYHNLQNGDGSGADNRYGYEFVSHDVDGYGYGDILHYYPASKEIF